MVQGHYRNEEIDNQPIETTWPLWAKEARLPQHEARQDRNRQ